MKDYIDAVVPEIDRYLPEGTILEKQMMHQLILGSNKNYEPYYWAFFLRHTLGFYLLVLLLIKMFLHEPQSTYNVIMTLGVSQVIYGAVRYIRSMYKRAKRIGGYVSVIKQMSQISEEGATNEKP